MTQRIKILMLYDKHFGCCTVETHFYVYMLYLKSDWRIFSCLVDRSKIL